MSEREYGEYEQVNGATLNAANKRIVELEAELAEQAKVLVANVDKQLALEAANKDLQAWFDNVKADYDALKASPTIRELSDEEIASTFEAAVKASPEYTEDDGDIPDDVRALIITCSRAILAKARGE